MQLDPVIGGNLLPEGGVARVEDEDRLDEAAVWGVLAGEKEQLLKVSALRPLYCSDWKLWSDATCSSHGLDRYKRQCREQCTGCLDLEVRLHQLLILQDC